ncbi:MAG: GNAT family N-acetyltransferase [Butyricicoccus pullicaecorum]|nr:GNAT family N-acetyltransferase [Butyricicoccus pullicaecorum]MDO4669614.1 GNAT family N-acetyltransferase [Butyricicoccus pullicaecorum]
MIRFAEAADMPEIRALWEVCFPDDTGFNDYYFGHVFALDTTVVYVLDGRIAAMVQMLPYTLLANGKTVPATYIYGACTHPDFRRRHLMSELLQWSFSWDIQHDIAASILIPQEKWLFDFYRPFGYLPAFTLDTIDFAECKPMIQNELRAMTSKDLPACEALYRSRLADCPLAVLRTPEQWQAQLTMFEVLGGSAFVLENEGRLLGYAFVWKEENGIWAQELICREHNMFLSALMAQTGQTQLRACVPSTDGEAFGCIKWHGKNVVSQNGYMNLMYN